MERVLNRKGLLGVSRGLWRDPRTWLLLLAITEKSLFRYAMLVLTMVTGIDGIGVFVMHSAYVILIALCLQKGSRFYYGDLLIILFVVMSVFFTWILYPDNIEKYMFGREQFWATVFPLFRYFIVGLFFIPNDETIDLAGKISCLAVFVETLFVMFILRGSELQENDDMSRAYFILLNVLFVVNYAFDRRTLLGIVFAILGVMFLVSMGARGPVIIILSFVALKIFQTTQKKGYGFMFIFVTTFLVWFVNSEYWLGFLYVLRTVVDGIGLSTRVIDFTIEGETLTYYSERDEIAELVLKKIKERPLFGWGVYGEWQFVDWNAHNIYLEILDYYGVVIGGIIILWMFVINFKAFFASKSRLVRGLVFLFACCVFVKGIFSGGFLSFYTFLMIGYCLQICRKTNFKYLNKV